MHRTSDEWKENVRNINETKPKQENCPTLKLARSLLKVVNYLGTFKQNVVRYNYSFFLKKVVKNYSLLQNCSLLQ